MSVPVDSCSTEHDLWEKDFKFVHMHAMQDSKDKSNPPNNPRDTQTSLHTSGQNNRRADYDRQRGGDGGNSNCSRRAVYNRIRSRSFSRNRNRNSNYQSDNDRSSNRGRASRSHSPSDDRYSNKRSRRTTMFRT